MVTSCNVDYYLEECAAVVITSPNYPASYDDNKTCSWLVISNELNRLHIQVTDFMTEDSYDNLHIGDGALIGNPVSLFADGTLSGSAQPVNFTSAQTTVWMRFVTDLDKSARGFRAVVTDLCDIDFQCASNSCLNNGECVNTNDNLQYFCRCAPAFTGDNCEIAPLEYTNGDWQF
eukprot:XP_011667407.1 PREDICTED: fibropellin-1-like [Strongylocentrotus purpuratus]